MLGVQAIGAPHVESRHPGPAHPYVHQRAAGDLDAADLGACPVRVEITEGVAGDTSETLVVEDDEFILRLSTRSNADGHSERVLYYEDIDGTHLSGFTTEPIEALPKQLPAEGQPPAPDEEGLGSFLEGALLGDCAGNDTWSAVAGQTAVGLIPIVGQIADARDTIAAVVDVAQGEEGGWGRLGGAAVG